MSSWGRLPESWVSQNVPQQWRVAEDLEVKSMVS